MTTTLAIDEIASGGDLPARIIAALAQYRVPLLRHVQIETRAGAIVLRGSVHSFYMRQVLDHTARRIAGDTPVVDELQVVTPERWRDRSRPRRADAVGAALLLLAVVSGCGKADVPDRTPVFPVSGQVIFNGKPAAGAAVVFHPKDPAAGFPVPRAMSDPQGNFVLSTYLGYDGAPAGEYKVTVVLEPSIKKGDEYVTGPNIIPQKYGHPKTTAIVATVAEGPNTVPIKITR